MADNESTTLPDAGKPYPGWFPQPIAAWIEANRAHPDHIAGRVVIDRLARSPALKTLWLELVKRKPIGFAYPANRSALAASMREGTEAGDDDEAQGLAVIALFKNLLHIGITPFAAKTEATLQQQVDELVRRAAMLRFEADDTELIPSGGGGIDWCAVVAGMRAKADVLEQAAAAMGGYRLVVPNARPNPLGLQTAIRISSMIEALFGQPLYLQSAAIAEEITGQSVTFEQVRTTARKHPTRVNFLPKKREKSHR